jgi:hypothetical protein
MVDTSDLELCAEQAVVKVLFAIMDSFSWHMRGQERAIRDESRGGGW